jgi:hypothetical protein
MKLRWKRPLIRWLALLAAWVGLTLFVVRFLYPAPMLVLPHSDEADTQPCPTHNQQFYNTVYIVLKGLYIDGFSRNGERFTYTPTSNIASRFDQCKKELSGIHHTYDLKTGETIKVSWSLDHHSASKTTPWYCDYPLGLDSLAFMQRPEGTWRVEERDSMDVLFHVLASEFEPVLVRRSGDKRWLALQSKSNDTLLVDLTKKQPPRTLAGEQVIQFTPDSRLLLTKIGDDSHQGLAAWELEADRRLWCNTSAPVTSLLDHLHQIIENDPRHTADYKHKGTGTRLHPQDAEPMLCSQGQAVFSTTRNEWKSPWADWLIEHNWYGFGSGCTWTVHHVIDLETGKLLVTAPRSSLGLSQCLLSPTGEFLAVHGKHHSPWLEQWVIYRLPFEAQYGKAGLFAVLLLVGLAMLRYVLRGAKELVRRIWRGLRGHWVTVSTATN